LVKLLNGTVYKTQKCKHPPAEIVSLRNPRATRIGNQTLPKLVGGWIADAIYVSSSYSTTFNGNWVVPGNPASDDGQILYFFTGLVPSDDAVIAQPVLEYYQNAWTLASWYCCDHGHSAPITTNVGHSVLGTMSYSGGTYIITSNDQTTSQKTTLQVTTTRTMPDYYVTLETYNIASCNDYPSGGITFTNLNGVSGGQSQNFAWQPQYPGADCNEQVIVNSPTSVTIKF